MRDWQPILVRSIPPQDMKALVYDRYATDDNFSDILHMRDIPEPVAGPNDVVFRVRAAALNYDDIWGMRGAPLKGPLPHISGTDAAGDVVEIGRDVTEIQVGDRIVSHGNISCRICRACASGREYDCSRRIIWGFQTGPLWGGYCEVAHLPESNVVHIPDNTSYEEAASASMTMTTAWHMLVRARVRPGQIVLIMGGGSGIGIFGIQIAKLMGCIVIATASPEKLDRCRDLGADYTINHRKADWDDEVRRVLYGMTNRGGRDRGVDVIFEHIGGVHWSRELPLLRRGGTIVTTGATTGYMVNTNLYGVIDEGISILGSTQGTRAELEEGLYWISRGMIKTVIDSAYPLESAAKAHSRMLYGRDLFGKMILQV